MESEDRSRFRRRRAKPAGTVPTDPTAGPLHGMDRPALDPAPSAAAPGSDRLHEEPTFPVGPCPTAAVDGSTGSVCFSSTARIYLASVFIAGFRFHHGMHPRVLDALAPGDPLILIREPGNPFDPFAFALYTEEGARLGYLPRGTNEPIASMADQGVEIHAVISAVDPSADPWERVRVVVWAELAASFHLAPGVN